MIGLFIRYAVAVYSAEGDTAGFAASALSMAYGQGPYAYLTNYPPGWLYLLGLLGRAFSLFSAPANILTVPPGLNSLVVLPFASYEPTFYPTVAFDLVLKSIYFVFDVLLGVLLYVMIRERIPDPRAATAGIALWMLNPLVITVSAIHGTFDGITAFLALLAYYLATKRDFLFSGISLGLGAVIGVFTLVLVPVFLLLTWDTSRSSGGTLAKPLGLFALGLGGMMALVFWPPGSLTNWLTFFFVGTSRGNEPFGGFNQWSVLSIGSLNGVAVTLGANATLVVVAMVVVAALALIFIAIRTARAPRISGPGFLAYWDGTLLLSLCAAYLLVPFVQSQYLLWVLPWVVLALAVYVRYTLWSGLSYVTLTAGATLYYLFGVTSPLFFFEPLAFNTHLLGLGVVRNSLFTWAVWSPLLRPFFVIPVAVILVVSAWVGVRLSGLRLRGVPV
ncbi:MAG: glycosyltransferase 87 family protein [Thermoplasmata archaeon]